MKKNNSRSKANETSVDKNPQPPDSDEEAGFSKWMRSNEGLENLKLFVLANSLLIFLLMTWPQIKETLEIAYYMYIEYTQKNMGVWKLVDNYFKDEFRKYLKQHNATGSEKSALEGPNEKPVPVKPKVTTAVSVSDNKGVCYADSGGSDHTHDKKDKNSMSSEHPSCLL